MKIKQITAALFLGASSLSLSAPTFAQDVAASHVSFANSGDEAAQEAFHRGLAALHNFEYDYAAEAFQEAQESDPDFAMAYWGEAMTHNHPVWQQQDYDTAIEILNRLGETQGERLAKAGTERERAYLETLHVLYGEGEKQDRDDAYADAMAELHASYPDDVDAAAFYALSLLGTAHEGRDFDIYMRAAAELEPVFLDHPDHPGVLHYMIHSYDDPTHAPLGLRPARLYADVAPNAGHAQHMISHIFMALGMWEDSITANQQADHVVDQQRIAAGERPSFCGHYNEWLIYSYLQVSNVEAAGALVDECRVRAEGELASQTDNEIAIPFSPGVFSYHLTELHYSVDQGRQYNPDTLELPDGNHGIASVLGAYAHVLNSRSDEDVLSTAVQALESRIDAFEAQNDNPSDPDDDGVSNTDIIRHQARGVLAMANGSIEDGLALLLEAAEMESSQPIAFGPPQIAKPSWELYGEALEAAGQTEDAIEAFETQLKRTPNRRITVDALERLRA